VGVSVANEEEQIFRVERDALRTFARVGTNSPPPDVKRAIELIREDAIRRAKKNAPIDTGALRKSIDVEVVQHRGEIEFTFVSNANYVIKVHEEQYRLGPTSASQPTTEEGGVGNKFFTRVVDKWGEHYMDMLVLSVLKSMRAEET
jgi:hypothetical protein